MGNTAENVDPAPDETVAEWTAPTPPAGADRQPSTAVVAEADKIRSIYGDGVDGALTGC